MYQLFIQSTNIPKKPNSKIEQTLLKTLLQNAFKNDADVLQKTVKGKKMASFCSDTACCDLSID